jgi:hypothetical protein
MKCQLQISIYCEKTFKKDKVAYIWINKKCLEVCTKCFKKLKENNKSTGKPSGRPITNNNRLLNKLPIAFRRSLQHKKDKRVGIIHT